MIVGKCSELAWEQSNLARILLAPEWDARPAVCHLHHAIYTLEPVCSWIALAKGKNTIQY